MNPVEVPSLYGLAGQQANSRPAPTGSAQAPVPNDPTDDIQMT
jgi:hypothetical protein